MPISKLIKKSKLFFKPLLSGIVVASIITIGVLGALTAISDDAYAKRKGERPVNNSIASDLFQDCLMSGDDENKEGSSYVRCCTKSLRFCIKCKKGGGCFKSPYRERLPKWAQSAATGGVVTTSRDDNKGSSRPNHSPTKPAKSGQNSTKPSRADTPKQDDRLKVD